VTRRTKVGPTHTGRAVGTGPLIGSVEPPELHVMTFNVRRRMSRSLRAVDKWSDRRSAVKELIATERPTLLGSQETRPDQAELIRDALGPDTRFVGYGRGGSAGDESNPLYYDSGRLELLEWRQSALSNRPDVHGSVSWGNLVPRALVIAVFRDRATSAEFIAVNTHLDHLSRRSRLQSAHQIRRETGGHGLPAIVMGDLNAAARSRAVRELLAENTLTDAWAAASDRVSPEWGTFADYRDPRVGGRRIDWILVTPTVRVVRAGINARRIDGRWPSDHLPVQAVVRMPGSGGAS
jgi:endonuclease/exonuclease/phosphatase family metal-dependent hydrolase